VAEIWGLELSSPDTRSALGELVSVLLDPVKFEDNIKLLPPEAQTALNELYNNSGRIPWAQFTRRFGIVREMGAGRRDREKPHKDPTSPAEILWYQALVSRAFFDTITGPEEFAYIPADLMRLLPMAMEKTAVSLGRPASPAEYAHLILTSDHILDDTCTLLAALRLGLPLDALPPFYSANISPESSISKSAGVQSPLPLPSSAHQLVYLPPTLQQLLASAGLLDASGIPLPEPTRTFLEAIRGEALLQLVSAWLSSQSFNELRIIPGLRSEGEWENVPLRTRQVVLEFLSTVPADTWWNLNAFIYDIKQHAPDFQRPAGDYDSWFIQDEKTEEFLRGFSNWDKVDGKLIRYFITGPMHWLGLIDLAAPSPVDPVSAFRHSAWSAVLLKGIAPEGFKAEEAKFYVRGDARLRIPRSTLRSVRYQVARFCLWEEEEAEAYRYRLTPDSLARARLQGLRINQLVLLLRRYASTVPPNLVKALERWEERGAEAHLERMLVLRVRSPELLHELRVSRAERFLGDPLGPTTIAVKPGAWEKVLGILAEMGFLGEWTIEKE